MTSKAAGHRMQRCMSDSESDDDECEGPPRSVNVYRNSAKKKCKAAWTSAPKSAPAATATFAAGAGLLAFAGRGPGAPPAPPTECAPPGHAAPPPAPTKSSWRLNPSGRPREFVRARV